MSTNINSENYELWLIDYLEGNLDKSGQESVELFLSQHPDIAEEYSQMQKLTLPVNELKLPAKDSLKKDLNDLIPAPFTSMDEYLVAGLENELNEKQKAELDYQLSQEPKLALEYKYLTNSRLEADTSVVFVNKDSLKKKAGIIRAMPVLLKYGVAVAAAILLFLTFILKDFDFNNTTNLMSENTGVTDPGKNASHEAGMANFVSPKHKRPAFADAVSFAFRKDQGFVENTDPGKSPTIKVATKTMIIDLDTATQYQSFVISVKNEENNKVSQVKQLEQASNNVWIEYEQQTEIVPSDNVKTLNEYVSSKLKNDILKKKNMDQKITVWDFASAGVNKISKLFGKSYDLDTQYRNDGKVSQLAFSSPRVNFVIPVNKKNN